MFHQLSIFVWQLKVQISNSEGLGGRLNTDEKATIRAELKNVDDWIEGRCKHFQAPSQVLHELYILISLQGLV